MLATILAALGDSLIKSLFSLLENEMQKRNLLAQGAAIQAAKETVATAQSEQAMAQALSDAPRSRSEVLDVLDKGAL